MQANLAGFSETGFIPDGGNVDSRHSVPLSDRMSRVVGYLTALRALELAGLKAGTSASPAKEGMRAAGMGAVATVIATPHPIGMLSFEYHDAIQRAAEQAKSSPAAVVPPDTSGWQIPVGLISEDQQTRQQAERELAIANGAAHATWVGSDADGNPAATMKSLLQRRYGVDLPEGATFPEAVNLMNSARVKAASSDVAVPQYRISAEDKKGMAGAKSFVRVIEEGVKAAPGGTEAERFAAFVGSLNYHSPDLYKDSYSEMAKAGVMDFMLRAFASPGSEMVISDYPADKKLLDSLLRLREQTSGYLSAQSLPDLAADKRFLPLGESEEAIKAVAHVTRDLLTERKDLGLSDWKLDAEDGKQVSRVGLFVGPSDVTRNVGGTAPFLIYDALSSGAELEKDLGAKIGLQYGQGTSARRGASVTFPGVHRVTLQGMSAGTHFAAAASGTAAPAVFRPSDEFLEKAAAFHRDLWAPEESSGVRKGKLPEWFDSAVEDRPNEVMYADSVFLNNNGTRSRPGLAFYGDQRAIPSADIASLSGSLTAPGFPEDMQGVDIKAMLGCPLAGAVVLDQLRQIIAVDNTRAEMQGVPKDVIEQTDRFAARFMEKLGAELKTEVIEFGSDDAKRRQAASELAEQLAKSLAAEPETARSAGILAQGVVFLNKINAELNESLQGLKGQLQAHPEGVAFLDARRRKVDIENTVPDLVKSGVDVAFSGSALSNAPGFVSRVGVGGGSRVRS